MLANNSNSGNLGTHYSLQEHLHQFPHHSPHNAFTKDSSLISHGNTTVAPPMRSGSSPSSYFLPAVQPRTSSYPMPSSHYHEKNSTSSSTIHPTIANLVTPTRASTSPINKASSSPVSFYKAYIPTVASYMSTTPDREVPKYETTQKYQYRSQYDDTIEEISDESESMMDRCEPQRGWSTSSSQQTNSPSPVMAPVDIHKLSLRDQPYCAQETEDRFCHHTQYQSNRAQPPQRHHHKQYPQEHRSILLPPTNIPEQDCNMEVESQEPDFEETQQTPSRITLTRRTTHTITSTTTSNPKRPPKEKRNRPKPVRAATTPVRPSHYDQMSDAQKRLYDHHPRSPEYEDDSDEKDEEDEDSSEPASPKSFSSMSRSPSPSRRMVARPERSPKDDLGTGPHNFHTSDVSPPYSSHYQKQYPSYGSSRYQTTPHISQHHHQQQHPYHHPDSHSRRSSYGSSQFSQQEKSFLDQPRLYSRPPSQHQQHHHQQQQHLPMRKYRRQHRPRQLLQQSLHAAGSLDGYPYASGPLTGCSVSSTGSSSSSMPALSPTDSFFHNSNMSPSHGGIGGGGSIPNLPGTEGMTVVRNEDGSIMVYNPVTDAMTFRCELCPLESFGRIHDLKRHQTSKHQEMTWPCDYCHRPFVRRDALLRHYTVKAARDDGIHPASHEVEKLLEARARAKMLY